MNKDSLPGSDPLEKSAQEAKRIKKLRILRTLFELQYTNVEDRTSTAKTELTPGFTAMEIAKAMGKRRDGSMTLL